MVSIFFFSWLVRRLYFWLCNPVILYPMFIVIWWNGKVHANDLPLLKVLPNGNNHLIWCLLSRKRGPALDNVDHQRGLPHVNLVGPSTYSQSNFVYPHIVFALKTGFDCLSFFPSTNAQFFLIDLLSFPFDNFFHLLKCLNSSCPRKRTGLRIHTSGLSSSSRPSW